LAGSPQDLRHQESNICLARSDLPSSLPGCYFAKVAIMPNGVKPGERRGGRRKGTPNKSTLERAILAEQIASEQRKRGKKLAREVLQDFVEMFSGLAAAFQPAPTISGAPLTAADMETWAKGYREPVFSKYATLAVDTASKLASYQTPKLKAVTLALETPPGRCPPTPLGTGTASMLSPQEAYRLLKEGDVIDLSRKPESSF
jgi:hypothetical protein